MAVQIQIRRGTSSNWTSANPVLAQGELGIELDTRKFKIGDGNTSWASLPYAAARPEDVTSEINAAVAQVLGDAPAVLDTLGELSDAINDDPNFVSTVTTLSGDFTNHTSATTSVHGIADTSLLETQSGAQSKADAAQSAAEATASADAASKANAAESAANSYTDSEIASATASLQSYADTAEADAVSTAAADAASKADSAEAAAKSYSDVSSVPLVQFSADSSVLKNLPSRIHPGEKLLRQAVWWIDSAHSSADGQSVSNLGWGGTALNGRLGSSASADSNDPKFLDWSGDNYVYLPGVSGNYLRVPDEAALDITGDIDIRVQVSFNTGSSVALLSKLSETSTNRSFLARIGSGRILNLFWSTDGTGPTAVSVNATTAIPVLTEDESKWLRFTLDVDNGAGGYDVNFYISDDGVGWSQVGSTVTGASTTSIHASSTNVEIGTYNTGVSQPLAGKIHRAQIFDGIDGTKVLDVDTSVVSGDSTSFTALTGQTVTVNRSTSSRKAVCVTHPVWLFGTDDYMEVSDNALLDFGASDSFTVLAVVRRWNTQAFDAILSKKVNTLATTVGWTLVCSTVDRGSFYAADGTERIEAENAAYTSGPLAVLSGVRDVVADAGLSYVNGTSVSDTDLTTGTMANSEAMRVGAFSGGGNEADMEFIAAAVWRRALTSGEITTLSNYFSGRVS